MNMADSSLVPLQDNSTNRNELRKLFKNYLQVSTSSEKLSWENYTTREGLAHNWIYDIYQDSSERIWVGTWGGGVSRYEGGRWQTFTTRQGLHCNQVTCIREDRKGKIWLATDSGLNVMEDDRIMDAGLTGKSLLNLTFDQDGDLWVGCWRAAHSGGGLFRLTKNGWITYHNRDELPGLEILKVFTDTRGRTWIGTYEQGVGAGAGCFDGTRWRTYTVRDGLVDNCVYSMFEDPEGNMWFGTIGGVSIFDNHSWHTLTKKDGLVDNRIYSMLIDSRKKMWFGTEAGVSRFDGQKWISYMKKDGLVENLVRSICEAKDGAIWFGTYPYAPGTGGISVARYPEIKTLTDQVLDLLPEPSPPRRLPAGQENTD
jgi:ligand-binding sensor domain-containing protein